MKKYFFILLFFVIVTLSIFFGVRFQKQNALTRVENQELFEQILMNPFAGGVSDIQGFKNQKGKPDTYLKFRVTNEQKEVLLKLHEYKKIDCSNEAVLSKLFAPKKIKHLVEGSVSFWNISESPDNVCYATFLFTPSGIEGKLYQNSLRQKAQSELLIDQKNNVVFFHESGILSP